MKKASDVKEFVRAEYGQAARQARNGNPSCCGTGGLLEETRSILSRRICTTAAKRKGCRLRRFGPPSDAGTRRLLPLFNPGRLFWIWDQEAGLTSVCPTSRPDR